MALTYTPAPEIGQSCPEFSCLALDGKTYSQADFSDSKIWVFMFICNHCPYVQAIEDRYLELAHSYDANDVQFIGVCSNDAERYPDDSFEALKENWLNKNFGFPYLFDETQKMAKDFGAVCTPDFFVYGSDRKLAYRGRLDDSWKEPEKVTRREMKEAIDLLLEKNEVVENQTPSMGCSIKWIEA